ncbi:MAG: NUDIX hydrolase [Tyzzerella sp.]|nr:NUDIX hydrolase [Tyzzerella sp.]
MGEFKRLNRTLSYQGKILKVYTDQVEVNGRESNWDYIHHNGGAAVVPVTEEGKILMVKQYRNALDRFTLEIPAGALDSVQESGMECVARELEEETGYIAKSIEWLINTNSWAAFTNEKVEIFVARDLVPSKQNFDEEESIELQTYTLDKLKEKIFSGEITDSKTVAGILAYAVKYE